ncbi:MAG: TldE/PmbA family protein [Herminiimonas sp.]|nr:TldE/PmbA family protein [Herminiimonas sp.]
MQQYFNDLADFLAACLRRGEKYKCWLSAEETDFVRFNRSAIRQPGHVRQVTLTLDLIDGLRHAGSKLTLSGNPAADQMLVANAIEALRSQLPDLPDDPHLMLADEIRSSEHIGVHGLPDTGTIVDEVLAAAQGHDLVGILAAGPVYRGFANSSGQRNWHQASSFNLDWSLYQSRDKAVKSAYAGVEWDSAVFHAKFAQAVEQLALLERPPVTMPPGSYRAYLTPTAFNEIISMFNWDGFSEKALRTKQSSLRRMRHDSVQLSPMLTLAENTAEGLAPGFQAEGFIKPACVVLLDRGRLVGSMVAPRTAMEYGIAPNGTDASETMASIDIAGGDLPMAEVLSALGTGIYVSNLWYLNYSDRSSCRITGMTRFATFWVEDGKIVAPLNVMRFDESLFSLLGDNLLALTREREMLIDGSSYGERQTGSTHLPGALVSGLTFVL